MKTERRHELHHNVLADWLGDQIERVRPYSRVVLGVILAAAVAILLYGYTSVQSSRHSQERWQQFFSAVEALQRGDAEPLTKLADSPAAVRTPMGYWAKLAMGDYSLNRGIDEMFSDRMSGRRSLEAAIGYFGPVSHQSSEPMLADRAILGMARAYESLNDLDLARKRYNELVDGKSAYAPEASQRLADLDRDATKQFYDWFSAAKLPRQNIGGIGLPGDRPAFGNLPDVDSFVSPPTDDVRLFNLQGVTGSGAAADEKAAEIPATDAPAPPAGETPSPTGDKPPAADGSVPAGSDKTP